MKVTTQNTIEKTIRWGLYVCAFIPLIVWRNYFSPFHFGKVILFRALIEILFVLFVILVMQNKRFLPKMNAIVWSFTAFVGAYFITSLFSVDVYHSFMGTIERMGGFFTLFHFWLFFIMLISMFKKKEQWIYFLHLSVIVGLMSLIYGFLQKAPASPYIHASGDRLRILGTLGNPAIFAGYQLMTMFFALALLFKTNKERLIQLGTYLFTALVFIWFILIPVFRGASVIGIFPVVSVLIILGCLGFLTFSKPSLRKDQIFYLIIVLANIVAIFSTAVRGSVLALFTGLIVFTILFFLQGEHKGLRNILIGCVTLLIIFEGILIGFKSNSFVQESPYLRKLSDFSLTSDTVQKRIWAWQTGFDGWNDSAKTIVVGWGPENFNVPFSVHFNPKFFEHLGSETLFDRAHNMFIEVLSTMGLVGIISYIAIFVVLFMALFRLWRRSTDTNEKLFIGAFTAGLVAYIVHNLFFFDTSANILIFVAFIASVYALSSQDDTKSKTTEFSSAIKVISVGVVVITVIVSLYVTGVRQIRANYKGTRAVIEALRGEHAKAVKMYEDVYSMNTFDNYSLINGTDRYAQYVINNGNTFGSKGVDVREVLKSIIDKEEELLKYNKQDYLPYQQQSRAYTLLAKIASNETEKRDYINKAIEKAQLAIDISPNLIRSYFDLADAHNVAGKYAESAEIYKKTITLNPDAPISYWLYGATQFHLNNDEVGFQNMEKALSLGYQPNIESLRDFINQYGELKNYKRIAELFELLIIREENIDNYAALVTAYIEAGETDLAIDTAHRLIARYPESKVQVTAFIKQRLGIDL